MASKLVAVGSSSTQKVTTSPDAVNWTAQGQGSFGLSNNPLGVAFAPSLNLWVAVVATTNGIWTSPDGVTWTQDASSTAFAPEAVAWSEDLGLFVAVGGGAIASSPDGTTWTTRLSVAASAVFHAVHWSPDAGLFMAAGEETTGGTQPCYTSPDGVTWTAKAEPLPGMFGDAPCRAITYAASLGMWFAVGNGGFTGRSTDNGTSWTMQIVGGVNLFAVDWSPDAGLFATHNTSGTLYTSPDGTTWTSRGSVAGGADILWVDDLGLFVNIGGSGAVSTSPDGVTWTSRTSGHAQQMNAVAWGASTRPRGILVGSVAA